MINTGDYVRLRDEKFVGIVKSVSSDQTWAHVLWPGERRPWRENVPNLVKVKARPDPPECFGKVRGGSRKMCATCKHKTLCRSKYENSRQHLRKGYAVKTKKK